MHHRTPVQLRIVSKNPSTWIEGLLTLFLGLILNNEGLALVVDRLGEFGGDGVVGCLVLEDKSLVASNAAKDSRLLYGPCANVGPFLLCVLLLCMGNTPSVLPVVCELLQEGCLESRWLEGY